MKKNRNTIINAFLPMVAIYLLYNGVSIMTSQLAMAWIVLQHGKIGYTELITETLRLLSSQEYNIWLTTISGFIGAVVFILWYLMLVKEENASREKKKAIILGNQKYLVVLGVIFVALGAQYVGTFIIELVSRTMPTWIVAYRNSLNSIGLAATGNNLDAPIPLIVYTVIGAPLMEEFAFRGVCLKYAKNNLPDIGAVVFTSLLFSVIHSTSLQMLYTFLLSMVIGYICVKTGKIAICVAIHILFNGVSIFAPNLIYMGDNAFSAFVTIFTSMVALYIGIMIICRAYQDLG